jgi:hypothetical protein
MTHMSLRFEDFEVEKLTKNQLKTILGGDPTDDAEPIDDGEPTKGGGGTGGNP